MANKETGYCSDKLETLITNKEYQEARLAYRFPIGVNAKEQMNNDSDFNRFKNVHMTYSEPYKLLKLENTNKKEVLYVCKMLTCPPIEHSSKMCMKCGKPSYDVIRHFVTECTTTFYLRDTFMDKIINYYGVQPYLTSQMSDEKPLVSLFKATLGEHEFGNDAVGCEFANDCIYFLYKAAQTYFNAVNME